MSERAQALASIRRAIYLHDYAPDALMAQIEALPGEAPAVGVSPQPEKLPTTLELSGTMPDIAHSRNCQCAECASLSP